MYTYKEIKQNIRMLIQNYYNEIEPLTEKIKIAWNDLNFSRPNLPYIGIKILSTSTIGHSELFEPNDEGYAVEKITKEFIVSVQFYSNNENFEAIEMLENLIFYLKSEKSNSQLNDLCVAYIDNSDVNDISDLIDSNNIENRAQTDITFRASYEKVDNVGFIDNVNFQGTYNK
jgi:hypothetical protein